MLRVVAVAADAYELAPWLSRLAQVEPLDWDVQFARKAKWAGGELYALSNGAGPRLAERAATAAARRLGHIDRLLSVGLCGGLHPSLRHAALCTAGTVGDGEQDWPVSALPGLPVHRLLSIDRFLPYRAEKEQWARRGFGMVEMEACGLAAWAASHDVPFSAVKAVSDVAEESFALDFNAFRDHDGRFVKGRIARAAALHPFRYVPDLIRIARRGKQASEKLGEFLAQYAF